MKSEAKKFVGDLWKVLFSSNRFKYLKSSHLNHYPIDYTWLNNERYFKEFDRRGLPVRIVFGKGNYVPSGISGNAFRHHSNYLKNNTEESKHTFLSHADWFLQYSDGKFPNSISILGLGLKGPWYSCLSQGLGISVLLRAWKITGRNEYLRAAECALECLYPNRSNGFHTILNNGTTILEEYPCQNPTHVLNGFLSALIGVHEYSVFVGDSRAAEYANYLKDSVEANIQLWDSCGWSLYEAKTRTLLSNYNTVDYHNLQISQISWLIDAYGVRSLEDVRNRWISNGKQIHKRVLALQLKTTYKLSKIIGL